MRIEGGEPEADGHCNTPQLPSLEEEQNDALPVFSNTQTHTNATTRRVIHNTER